SYATLRVGKQYLAQPFESDYRSGTRVRLQTGEKVIASLVDDFADLSRSGNGVWLHAGDSRSLSSIPAASVDHVVTDPPYADSVQYSELADFFYVWLRTALGDIYP